jgi:hypothetical protein
MDPLGFALEHFDAIGRWRDRAEGGAAIDASGSMPDGTRFSGITELRPLLSKNASQFVTVLTERLLVYSLGRGIEYRDAPAVRQIVRRAAASDYRFQDLVIALVNSVPFQMRSARAESASAAARP